MLLFSVIKIQMQFIKDMTADCVFFVLSAKKL